MAERQTQVLFLDDDPEFLRIILELAVQLTRGAWNVGMVHDTGSALAELQSRHIDLLVIDVHMPVVDGLQFLRLLSRKYPNLLKVVLTGDSTGAYRDLALNNGAELFLEKPRDAGGWQSIFATLSEVAKFKPEEGFRGVLRRVGLQDVIQMECLSRNSSVLEISTNEKQGQIFIREGRIIHAVAGSRTGDLAFNHLLRLTGGEFNLRPFADPGCETIAGSCESLLMEAAQQRDEALEPPAGDPWPGPEPGSPADLEAEALASGPLADAPREADANPTDPHSRMQPRTEEFFICSTRGDVLYEWQCADSNARINFLEALSQKSRMIAQGLPLGSLERVEVSERQNRLVIQVEADRALLLRTGYSPVALAEEVAR